MTRFALRLAGATLPRRLVACAGAATGIAIAAYVAAAWGDTLTGTALLLAPIGASAVLVYAVPSSPLAQPWSLIAGNTLSALVGWATGSLIASVPLAAGIAVGGAILVMTFTRSLHPPGGAVALMAVPWAAEGASGWAMPLAPIAFDSMVLAATALVFHRLTGTQYPHRASPAAALPDTFDPDDIRAALDNIGETFDVAPADLDAILAQAERHRAARLAKR